MIFIFESEDRHGIKYKINVTT